MLNMLGRRQQELLGLLLKTRTGLTVDELAARLAITRNAVRLHLNALEKDRLVAPGATRPTGGRPEQLYVLSDQGRELFPRQYSWFAQLLVDAMRQEAGSDGLRERLGEIGGRVGESLRSQTGGQPDAARQVEKLSAVMTEMGYQTKLLDAPDELPLIEADNCVFHHLAIANPEVCAFDLALLERFTGRAVEHQECMAKGGRVCRFKFTPK